MICELSSSVCEARDIACGCPAFDDGAPGSILQLVAAVLDFFLDAARMHDLDIVAVDLDLGAVDRQQRGGLGTRSISPLPMTSPKNRTGIGSMLRNVGRHLQDASEFLKRSTYILTRASLNLSHRRRWYATASLSLYQQSGQRRAHTINEDVRMQPIMHKRRPRMASLSMLLTY